MRWRLSVRRVGSFAGDEIKKTVSMSSNVGRKLKLGAVALAVTATTFALHPIKSGVPSPAALRCIALENATPPVPHGDEEGAQEYLRRGRE